MSTIAIERRRIIPGDNPTGPVLPDLSKYSLERALAQAARNDGRLESGFEAEVDQELRRGGRESRGFLVPWSLPVERRNLGFGSAAGYSGMAAAQTTLPDMLIDVLRAKLAVDRLGGQIKNFTPDAHSGGGVAIPRKVQAAQISWVGDGSAAGSESNMVIDQALMVPHTATAYTDVTRRMLKLGGPGFQDKVVSDLLTGLSVAIDAAALNGPGLNSQPQGLFQNPNVPHIAPASDSGNGGAPAWSDLVALEQLIGVAGGDSPVDARIGFVTSPEGRSILRRTPELSGGVIPIWKAHTCRNPSTGAWESYETCMGHMAVATTNAPRNITQGTLTTATSAVLGNFTDMVVNLFTSFDVLVNPYLVSTSGIIRISAFVDVDTTLLHLGSFAVLSGINPT